MEDDGALTVEQLDITLRPDAKRVVAKMFLPGQELLTPGASRADAIIGRVLKMDEAEVILVLEEVVDSFKSRHKDLMFQLDTRYALVRHRVDSPQYLSLARQRLIGAYFTQEYAIESAALFNPSMVPHPDQSDLPEGSVRFVMSLRGVGEGHVSSIEFRTGVVDKGNRVTLTPYAPHTALPRMLDGLFDKRIFTQQLEEIGGEHANASYVLDLLPDLFRRTDLDGALARLSEQTLTRGNVVATIAKFNQIASCNYMIAFTDDSSIDERVILPVGMSESHGMEDVRLTQFTEDDGTMVYKGTYTAFDGAHVTPQQLTTTDFKTFTVSQLSGPAAKDKGMALFPKRLNERYLALSRWDRENNSIAVSEDGLNWQQGPLDWEEAGIALAPRQPWEVIQVGNCGPPIETPAGWLVITHGVGPMREYNIGAMLLDYQDPQIVLGRLKRPLLKPSKDDRDGYVPNVVYSCGGMLHQGKIVLPYGCDDSLIKFCLVDVEQLTRKLMS